jgi:hypothetical protein
MIFFVGEHCRFMCSEWGDRIMWRATREMKTANGL